jgi:hypothetical protein
MPTGNLTSTSPATGKGRLAIIIAMVPIGIALGFLGGLLIQTIIGVIAVTVFSAEPQATYSTWFLGSLPVLAALIGAVLAPVLYAHRRGRRQADRPVQ